MGMVILGASRALERILGPRSRDLRYRGAPFSRLKGSVCTFQAVFALLRQKAAKPPEIAIETPRLQRGSWGIFMKQGARSDERLKITGVPRTPPPTPTHPIPRLKPSPSSFRPRSLPIHALLPVHALHNTQLAPTITCLLPRPIVQNSNSSAAR